MKKILLFTFLLFGQLPFLTAQHIKKEKAELKCVYSYQLKPFLGDTTIITEEVVLFIGKNYSMYKNLKTYESHKKADELMEGKHVKTAFSSLADLFKSMPECKTHNISVFKDYQKKEQYISSINKPFYTYRENKLSFDWKIIGTQKKIKGYECIEARTTYAGRTYIAWFTPEIPSSDGPYKFYGLPGLILSISDIAKEHNFTIISIEKETVESIKDYHYKDDILTKKQTDKLKKKNKKLVEMGYNICSHNPKIPKMEDQSEEAKKELLLAVELFDNPMELEPLK